MFTITSPAFKAGERIPVAYTGEGTDFSPPLEWSAPPPGTRSLALICDDPDAPAGTWDHWLLWNLPADLRKLPENVARTETVPALDNARQGLLDQGFAFCGANAHRVDKIVPVAELLESLKYEYEAAFVQSLVTLKDEYLKTIEKKFANLRQEYMQARQQLIRLRDETGRAWDKKIKAFREEYEKAHGLANMLKKEYETALDKLNALKERFPEKLAELQAMAQRFQADLALNPVA